MGRRLREIDIKQCYVSDISIAELTYGAYHSDRVQDNLDLLRTFIGQIHVVPFSKGIDEYGKQKDMLVKAGLMIEDFDLLIGCTAVSLDMIMVTDNVKHFSRINGISIENWVER